MTVRSRRWGETGATRETEGGTYDLGGGTGSRHGSVCVCCVSGEEERREEEERESSGNVFGVDRDVAVSLPFSTDAHNSRFRRPQSYVQCSNPMYDSAL